VNVHQFEGTTSGTVSILCKPLSGGIRVLPSDWNCSGLVVSVDDFACAEGKYACTPHIRTPRLQSTLHSSTRASGASNAGPANSILRTCGASAMVGFGQQGGRHVPGHACGDPICGPKRRQQPFAMAEQPHLGFSRAHNEWRPVEHDEWR
jgi:hypothetical protein